MSFFDRLKKYKILHWLYNLAHYKELRHNRDAYRKYNIHKPLFSSLSSKDFPDKTSRAWLDTGHSRELVATRSAFHQFDISVQEQLLSWSDNGYMILDGFFSNESAEAVNSEIDRLVAKKKLHPTHDNKLMFANKLSSLIRDATLNKNLIALLDFILDKEVVPFQTINFLKGSNQRAHSDSIHMTTYPLGYLLAVWIALEDTNPDNGPLFYYPGSHRLPYLLNSDFNEGETAVKLGNRDYHDYEDVLEQTITNSNFQKKIFLAKKGDVFIWHANLIHGGMPVNDSSLTRKSMVIHYFARDVIKYHEITERPSLLKGI